jgi:hypothetical protein
VQNWVNGLGYATQAWVNGLGLATQAWVTGLGYATQAWVTAQGFPAKPTLTIKKGSSNGTDYAIAAYPYAAVDAANLTYTAVIPAGWKLLVNATGVAKVPADASHTLMGGSTTINDSVGGVIGCASFSLAVNSTSPTVYVPWAITAEIVGDGNSHTVQLQSCNAQGPGGGAGVYGINAAMVLANSMGLTPSMTCLLTPSN